MKYCSVHYLLMYTFRPTDYLKCNCHNSLDITDRKHCENRRTGSDSYLVTSPNYHWCGITFDLALRYIEHISYQHLPTPHFCDVGTALQLQTGFFIKTNYTEWYVPLTETIFIVLRLQIILLYMLLYFIFVLILVLSTHSSLV